MRLGLGLLTVVNQKNINHVSIHVSALRFIHLRDCTRQYLSSTRRIPENLVDRVDVNKARLIYFNKPCTLQTTQYREAARWAPHFIHSLGWERKKRRRSLKEEKMNKGQTRHKRRVGTFSFFSRTREKETRTTTNTSLNRPPGTPSASFFSKASIHPAPLHPSTSSPSAGPESDSVAKSCSPSSLSAVHVYINARRVLRGKRRMHVAWWRRSIIRSIRGEEVEKFEGSPPPSEGA
ncbi:hypothetical protein QBC32DRAFT_334965 [Pseudoneurospora amorphoporcata]|uniref:Uncharacterized protein n=1 Tax=Pseudoneurospora amorphoporcata TaxID=241081 RepID=A0AAN6NZG0_9PEZI|nr:hypothetical protein QBC32DRAFT_334965 [Pseudoneurospora amorphoporcata]